MKRTVACWVHDLYALVHWFGGTTCCRQNTFISLHNYKSISILGYKNSIVKCSKAMLATGEGTLPVERIQTSNIVQFGFKLVQKLDSVIVTVPNPNLYQSTCRFCWVWLDESVSISGAGFQVFLFMDAIRSPSTNGKIWMLAWCCISLVY